jgi:hypothetical protein
MFVSTAHTAQDVDETLAAAEVALGTAPRGTIFARNKFVATKVTGIREERARGP